MTLYELGTSIWLFSLDGIGDSEFCIWRIENNTYSAFKIQVSANTLRISVFIYFVGNSFPGVDLGNLIQCNSLPFLSALMINVIMNYEGRGKVKL